MRQNPKASATSTSIVPVRGTSGDAPLAAYCPDLEQWPASWMYEPRDLLPGHQMVECFKPFLRHLLTSNLSAKTLRKHRDNLWLLGGEIISDLHESPRLRKRPMAQVVFAALNDEGGPLISNPAPEEQQRSFDSTCRKLHRFLKDDGCGG
jgi:hypothetical protein